MAFPVGAAPQFLSDNTVVSSFVDGGPEERP